MKDIIIAAAGLAPTTRSTKQLLQERVRLLMLVSMLGFFAQLFYPFFYWAVAGAEVDVQIAAYVHRMPQIISALFWRSAGVTFGGALVVAIGKAVLLQLRQHVAGRNG